MPIPGQPPPSATLQSALDRLNAGKPDEGEEIVYSAARKTKAHHGSGSHPLALAYADLARYHYITGEFKKSAAEFRHTCHNAMPPDAAGRADRLAFMFGFAASVEALGQFDEAVKAFRQCVTFARSLHGQGTPGYAAALEPLAARLLLRGNIHEAMQLADEAYGVLWKHGDPRVAWIIPVRAEALKATGRPDNAFADLASVPNELAADVVAKVLLHSGEPLRMRAVYADLLKFADRKFGDGHPATSDVLAVIARHEGSLGEKADVKVRTDATRRAVWSFAVRRVSPDLLTNLEVGFEPGDTIHLGAHLSRFAGEAENAALEDVLTQAVEDLYTRAKPTGGL